MKIAPFNAVFFLLLALIVAAAAGLTRLLRGKSERVKRNVLASICAADIVIFFAYKYQLSIDPDFPVIRGIAAFNWFDELPLQLCNINMFLIPIALFTRKKAMLGFTFYTASLGACLAMLAPEAAFTGYSVFLPRVAGYYLTHALVMLSGLCVVLLEFYRPTVRDFPGVAVCMLVLTLLLHIVNLLLRVSGLCAHANYFFTCEPSVGALRFFWRLIPVPYLYEVPTLIVLLLYMVLVSGVYRLTVRCGKLRGAEQTAG